MVLFGPDRQGSCRRGCVSCSPPIWRGWGLPIGVDMTSRVIDDARRWAAFHGVGTYQLLMEIHAALEDTRGMISQDQPQVAAHCARDAMLFCLSVRSLATKGELWMEDQDPF